MNICEHISNNQTPVDQNIQLQFNAQFINNHIQFYQMTDEDLSEYQKKLIQLLTLQQQYMDAQEPSQISSQIDSQDIQKEIKQSHQAHKYSRIVFKFKDAFLDQLQGRNHQIQYIGCYNHLNRNSYEKNSQILHQQKPLLKSLCDFLFQISVDERNFYPHLFTHIKEQFYKPNIFINQQIDEKQIQFKKGTINQFFQLNQEVYNYKKFIKDYPDFQEICLMVLQNIIIEQVKRKNNISPFIQSQRDKKNLQLKKSFSIIQILCKKFLIQIQYIELQCQNQITIISLGSQKRFLVINQLQHYFFVILQKLQLLAMRRKSSHNILVSQKNRKNSGITMKSKKSSWKQTQDLAYFRIENDENNNLNQNTQLNTVLLENQLDSPSSPFKKFIFPDDIDESDYTSNYQSSVLNTESKFQEVSDESTPKFKNSSVAQKNNHIRKKSHKDSFGGVDFDNLVYKDLSNPKKFIQHKGLRQEKQKDKHKNNFLSFQANNKKVFSQRFQAQQMSSLTYNQDEQSSIEFVPNFQIRQNHYFPSKNKQNVSVNQNQPASPTYMTNTYFNFPVRSQNDENKYLMIKKMKGSNIQKLSQPYFHLQELQQSPKLKNKSSQNSNYIRPGGGSGKALTSSQIIEFNGDLSNMLSQRYQTSNKTQKLNIPAHMNGQNKNSILFSNQNDVFLSFSKNDKLKFIVQDCQQFDVIQKNSIKQINTSNNIVPRQSGGDHTSDSLLQLLNNEQLTKKIKQKKYNYRTQKQQRQKFKQRQKSLSNYQAKQISLQTNSNYSPKKYDFKIVNYVPQYQAEQRYGHKNSQNIYNNRFESNSQINDLQKNNFSNQHTKNTNCNKLHRKQSQYVPLYNGVEVPQQNFNENSRRVLIHNQKNNIDRRFQENSVRFSQIVDDNDEIFYVQKNHQHREGNNHKKQRKATDFYQNPSSLFASGGNRTSQLIQKGPSIVNGETTTVYSTNKYQNNNKFQGSMSYLDVSMQNSTKIYNSGGGKNYSIISNISYDEERRLDDLIQLENGIVNSRQKSGGTRINADNSMGIRETQLDFANIQVIQKLLIKKKKQKIQLSSNQINLSVIASTQSEPKDWTKKQVFYFFQNNPQRPQQPIKRTFYNKVTQNTSINTHQHNSLIKNHTYNQHPKQSSRPTIHSSTSLYNFSTLPPSSNILINPQQQHNNIRQTSLSNKSVSDKKLSIEKSVSKNNIQNSNSIILKSNHYSTVNLNNFNNSSMIAIKRQPDAISNTGSTIVRPTSPNIDCQGNRSTNYSVRNVPINNTIKSNSYVHNIPYHPLVVNNNKLAQDNNANLRTYPSQPMIKFPNLNQNMQNKIHQPVQFNKVINSYPQSPTMNYNIQQNHFVQQNQFGTAQSLPRVQTPINNIIYYP